MGTGRDGIVAWIGIIGIAFCVENLHPEGHQDSSIPLSLIVDHIEYAVDHIGIDHVGIGSDFDGAVIPEAMKDVTGVGNLISLLENRGFTDTQVKKLAHENWLRVISDTWKK